MENKEKMLQCRASPALVAALDEIAKTRFNGTRSAVVRDALQTYVENSTLACCKASDPIKEEVMYLHDVLLQDAEADSLVKKEVERLCQMIQQT